MTKFLTILLAIVLSGLVCINPILAKDKKDKTEENQEKPSDSLPQRHSNLTYTGPDMCLSCHENHAQDLFESTHYQWQGEAPYMVSGPELQGKNSNAVNTYCGNIKGNFEGCSACHVGRGEVPEPTMSQAQLENIDCLVCHQNEYRRVKVDGIMQPDLANMSITMDEAVQTVHLPNRSSCLGCHALAGGKDAVKRGDLALASGNTQDRNYDVHMATTGADLSCQACHITENHRIAGKGSDIRPTDLDVPVECSNCHSSSPHDDKSLNAHTSRVACQTCHIPVYAKNAADTAADEATEVDRSWQSGSDHAHPPLHPVLTLANDLKPEYKFWNRFSKNYVLGEQGHFDIEKMTFSTSRPVGAVDDPNSKLYPFKYKTSDYPLHAEKLELIPLDTSVFFATADADEATRAGLVNMGYSRDDDYIWVTTDTYQLLNHQVSPSDDALDCASCHLNTQQMDLQGELGYKPVLSRTSCANACHDSSKSFEWTFGDMEDFNQYHKKHVAEKEAKCIDCHSFSRPEYTGYKN